MAAHGTRGEGLAAAQLREVLRGLHTSPLAVAVLPSIAADAVDGDEQLTGPAATLAPVAGDVEAIHEQVVHAFTALT